MELQQLIDYFTSVVDARRPVLERVWGFRLRQIVDEQVKVSGLLNLPTRIANAHAKEAEKRYADIKRLIIIHSANVQSELASIVVEAAEKVLTDRMTRIHDDVKSRFQDELNGRNIAANVNALSQFLDAKYEAALMWVALAIREETEVAMQQRQIREATLDSAKASMRAAVAGEKAAEETEKAAVASAASAASASKSAFWTKVSAIGTVVAAVATAVAAIATAVATSRPSESLPQQVFNQQITHHSSVGISEAK